jgi:hypothetical protein
MTVFDHFDHSHEENFCAAVLLLVRELDTEGVGQVLVDKVSEAAGLGAGWKCAVATREVGIVPDDEGHADRTDIVLFLRRESERRTVLVEVKVHERWHLEHVVEQLRRQGDDRPLRTGEKVDAAVLLGPTRLVDGVRAQAESNDFAVSWAELLAALESRDSSGSNSELFEQAVQHLRNSTGVAPGADGLHGRDLHDVIQGVGVLEGLLDRCLRGLGGQKPQKLYTHVDGKASVSREWTWRAVQRQFELDDKKYWIGVWSYLEGSKWKGVQLELYDSSGRRVEGVIIDGDRALTAEYLDQLRAEFLRKCEDHFDQ